MARTSREVWRKRVERLHDSDLTEREFAAEIGVNLHTLRSWKRKFREERAHASRESDAGSAGRPRGRTGAGSKRPTFVEVKVAADEVIELRVAGVEVRVPIGFDEATLSRVVAVLRQAA